MRHLAILVIGFVVLCLSASCSDDYKKYNTYSNKFNEFIGIAEVIDRQYPDTMLVANNNFQHVGRHYFWWQTPVRNEHPDSAYQEFLRGNFKPWRGNPFGQPPNNNHYWFLLLLKNKMPNDTRVAWSFHNMGYSITMFRQFEGTGFVKLDSSSMHAPLNERPYPSRTLAFPLTIKSGETLVLLAKVQKTNKKNMLLVQQVSFADDLVSGNDSDFKSSWAFFGFFPLAVLYNLLFFFVLKERIYFYQAAYIFSAAILAGNNFAIYSLVLPDGVYRHFSYMPEMLPAVVSGIFIIVIFKKFVHADFKFPALNRVLNLLLMLGAVAASVAILAYLLRYVLNDEAYFNALTYLQWPPYGFLALFFPLQLIATVFVFNKVDTNTRIYAVALSLSLLLWGFHMTNILGITNRTFFPHNNLLLALALEISVFTWLMVMRYQSERNEKIKLLEQKLYLQQKLSASIVVAQESERKRIAEELHDGLGGYLVAVRLMVNNKRGYWKEKLPEVSDVLASIENKLDKALMDVREISHNLMPGELNASNLKEVIKERLGLLNENSPIRFEYYIDDKVNTLDESLQVSIYRIASELLKNTKMHSGATLASLQLIVRDQLLILQLEDNGNGFDPAGNSKGIGLKNIQSRVDFHGGKFVIDSGKTQTTFIIEIPLVT